MSGRKQQLLSQAGREVLIKAVVQAIPYYAMQCFKLSKGLIDKLMIHVRRFFWHGDPHAKHIHWLRWEKVAEPKDQGGMGFRDLECVTGCSFLLAKKGPRPSWIWQSLLHGRELLVHGLRWQVGNGRSIHFWYDKWVASNEDFHVKSPRGPFAPGGMVSDFITNDGWDMMKLEHAVSKVEACQISQIPISITGSPDKLIWHYESKGSYNVKSGYRIAINLKNRGDNTAVSTSGHPRNFWKHLWSLNIPLKIRTFWWRACSNALATRENLFRRSCCPCPTCPICSTEVESIEHLLFGCPWTRSVWFGSSLSLQLDTRVDNIVSWVVSSMDDIPLKSDKKRFHELIAITAWHIWKARNRFIFEDIKVHPPDVVQSCLWYERELYNLTEDGNVARPDLMADKQETSLKWLPPPRNSVKINCDAAFSNDQAAIGVVSRDHNGKILWCSRASVKAKNVITAELLAIRLATDLARSHCLGDVIIESDSQNAVNLCSQVDAIPWEVSAILEDIKNLAALSSVTFRWIPRSCNRAAHEVAKIPFMSLLCFFWDVDFPDSVSSVARDDIS